MIRLCTKPFGQVNISIFTRIEHQESSEHLKTNEREGVVHSAAAVVNGVMDVLEE
jgi:hypothetical protein